MLSFYISKVDVQIGLDPTPRIDGIDISEVREEGWSVLGSLSAV